MNHSVEPIVRLAMFCIMLLPLTSRHCQIFTTETRRAQRESRVLLLSPLKALCVLCASVVFILFWTVPCVGESRNLSVRVKSGIEYDSNPFKRTNDPAGKWIAKSYISADLIIYRSLRTYASLEYRGGFKRYLGPDAMEPLSAGNVTANDFELEISRRLLGSMSIVFLGEIKNKNANQVSGEYGYLRESGDLSLKIRLLRNLTGKLFYTRSSEGAQDLGFPSFSAGEVGVRLGMRFAGRLRVHLQFTSKRLDFERKALALERDIFGNENPKVQSYSQEDRLSQIELGLQLYRGFLLSSTYSFQKDDSNSYGYSFKANRFSLLLAKSVARGMVLQLYVIFQMRDYSDPISLPPVDISQAEEWEHNVLIARVSRAITDRHEAQLQYGFYRSGSHQRENFYTKNVCSLSFNLTF